MEEQEPQEKDLQPEKPIYILQQSKKRTIVPKAVSLLVLGVIFYSGILLNISLLNLNGRQETLVKTISLAVLIVIIITGIALSILKAKKTYRFYRDGIALGRKRMDYANITNTRPHRDPFDRIFKTYSINLGNKFFLRHIPQDIDIQDYLQQLINYVKNQ